MVFDPSDLQRPALPQQDLPRAPLAGTTSQSIQRLQVGLFGLAAMVTLVTLANIIRTNADENEATVSGATLSALEMALRADLTSLQQVAAGALTALRPLLRAQLHYHLGTSQLRTRQVMIEAQALDR